MKDYCLWIVSPPGYIHSHAFDDVALSLKSAFGRLGYDVPLVRDPAALTGRPIVLGGNLLPRLGQADLAERAIVYNLEQIQPGSPWITVEYLNLLRSHEVWDFSPRNIKELERLGATGVRLCRLGYVPELTRIKPGLEDIDVFFYGSLNRRRLEVLRAIERAGARVEAAYGVYGRPLDDLIARSRIVLNVHFYEAKVFEIVRVFYLLANQKFVISETGRDPDLEKQFEGGLVFCPYENLAAECLKYLADREARIRIAGNGLVRMKALSQVDFLRTALDEGRIGRPGPERSV
ncbi:MAG: hypothetical protein AB1641_28475 [Thermodesulfobacteriota bacterium]